MRKITPKPLMKVRDSFAIIRDNKIIANQNLYTEDGELLTPQGYPIPRFSTTTPVVGDARLASSADTSVIAGLVADSGHSAFMRRQGYMYNSTVYGNHQAGEGRLATILLGIDGMFPGVYTQKSGTKAGRRLARHPSGTIDVTSDLLPVVVEPKRAFIPESYGTKAATDSGAYMYPSRIVDETDGAFIGLSQQYAWSLNNPNTTTSYTNYPVQMVTKEFDSRIATKEYTKWQQYGIIPILYDEENKVLFSHQMWGSSNNGYGSAGVGLSPVAFKFMQGTNEYDVQQQSASPVIYLDSFINSSSSILSSNTNAGFRALTIPRSIMRSETQASLFTPHILSRTDATQYANQVGKVTLMRHDYTYGSGSWTQTIVNIVDENNQPILWNDEQFSLTNGLWNSINITDTETIVHFDLSFAHVIEGETYIFVLRVGTSAVARASTSLCTNTIQYVFKLDPLDKSKAILVNRELLPGFFGITNEGVGSFAGHSDYTRLYVMGVNGIYRLKLEPSTLRYVLDETMINVAATDLVVTDNEDLWFMDLDSQLYNLRASNSDIVRVAFAENTNTEFAEAPYDVEVRVSTVNHLGQRASRSVELVVEGNAAFKANNRNKITVTTSSTDDIAVIVTVKDYGQIYVTPTSVS